MSNKDIQLPIKNMPTLIVQNNEQKGKASVDMLRKALARQRLFGGKIGSNLVALGLVKEDQLSDFFRFFPTVPHSLEATLLEPAFILDLILKHALSLKSFNLSRMVHQIKLTQPILRQCLDELRQLGLIEITRGDTSFNFANYQYAITSSGINRALSLIEENRYVGPAPVCLEDYRDAVEFQTISNAQVTIKDVKEAFSDIVLGENYLQAFGAAINSGKPLFLYGPPGNGKTIIAEAIGKSLPDSVFIPYAVMTGGQVIVLYDEVNHHPVPEENDSGIQDQRWVKIRRPVVISGGELSIENLDLQFNSFSKYYEAPLHMKANNGMFILDDFGRQKVDTETLLNRWVVPLDHRVDYLTLHTGIKFEIPFDQFVIFATNMAPKTLVDNAFLRRLRYKLKIDHPTLNEYKKIFQKVCSSNGLDYNPKALYYLLTKYKHSKIKINGCHPRDLIDHIIDEAHYLGKSPRLTEQAIDTAWENYFFNE
jgi:predicted ATPase with chaperone activity